MMSGTAPRALLSSSWSAKLPRSAATCAASTAALTAGAADATGDYNDFWAQRDYRTSVSKVTASVFVVHGINDTNVTTSQFALWWDALAARGVERKIWLSQEGHTDPFDIRRSTWVNTLHRWFDHYLQGLPNGIQWESQASIEAAPGQWRDEPTWPARTTTVPVALGAVTAGAGVLGGAAPSAGATASYRDNPALTEDVATATPSVAADGRIAFLSAPLTSDVRVSGIPSVTLRVRVDKPTTELTARLVDYGTATRVDALSAGGGVHQLTTQSCWGESTTTDDACYFDTAETLVTADRAVVTRGWLDAAHAASLSGGTPLQPGLWYTVTVPLQATDAVLAAGHVLGLVLTQSDTEYTQPASTGATVEISLADSSLALPIVGAASLPVGSSVAGAPDAVVGGSRPSSGHSAGTDRRLLP